MAGPVNMAGGQPFSMANLKEVSAITNKYGIKLGLSNTRNRECILHKIREKGYEKKSIEQILKKCVRTSTALGER
jgi:tyrosine phenol-lyase